MGKDSHISDRDLLLAADGELSARRAAAIRAHLESCWNCRTRRNDLEATIGDFVHAHRENLDAQVSPMEGPRAMLRARMAEVAAESTRSRWFSWQAAAAGLAMAAVLVGVVLVRQGMGHRTRLVPDPRLTPGTALPISEADVCMEPVGDRVRFIPASMGKKVFDEYGIRDAGRSAYELDYLIDPELGGADDVRNFWPQPYSTTGWNSHLKDALEDKLHELVCGGKITLAMAQHDISTDWIAAYKKYFQTDRPLPWHYGFTKDRPWDQAQVQ